MNRIQYSTGGNITLAIDCVVSPAANGRIALVGGCVPPEGECRTVPAVGRPDRNRGHRHADRVGQPRYGSRRGRERLFRLCLSAGRDGRPPVFKISLNATYPSGYDADTSRKIGGFHTLCLAAGTISGHPLTGYATEAILPYSVWDLKWRPASSDPRGLVYSTKLNRWGDIYLMSGTGLNSASAFGAAFTVNRDWNSFVDDLPPSERG